MIARWCRHDYPSANEPTLDRRFARRTGWKPNPQRSAVADSVWGPWKELGNPAQGPDAATTYGSQTAYVLPVAGKPGAFVWIGDRWHPENLADSRYVLLPVAFTSEGFQIPWLDAWDLSYFDDAK